MTPQQALDAAQVRLVELAVEHQARLNALAIREAAAKADAAEWEARRAKMVFDATTEALKREGFLVGGKLS